MQRIFICSQSNEMLFLNKPKEQAYDQRGGLCQAGKDDIIITTDPINKAFLRYWRTLGFEIPHLIHAGPYEDGKCLSDLITEKNDILQEILARVQPNSRLEFFWLSKREKRLAEKLEIDPYCSFDLSIELAKKPVFKRLFDKLNIPTPEYFICSSLKDLIVNGEALLRQHGGFFLKGENSTGGSAYQSMEVVRNEEAFHGLLQRYSTNDKVLETFGKQFVVERLISNKDEFSIHFEISEEGVISQVGIFDQLSTTSYEGVAWPSNADRHAVGKAKKCIEEKLGPYLVKKGALGFFCADVVVDEDSQGLFIDFNPRKGAILYVHSLAEYIFMEHFDGKCGGFYHKSVELPEGARTFEQIHTVLEEKLAPKDAFVVISNPGLIPFGSIDITGISRHSRDEARKAFEDARDHLLSLI